MNRVCKNCVSFQEGMCKIDSKINKEGKTEYTQVEPEGFCNVFEEKNISKELKECYYTIIEILKKFLEMEERYYPIVALWIMGTYAHDEFETYPYLFINAVKGSGKSRLLRLIATLSKNGKLQGSLTESVLFRNAKGRTFCIDEFEDISSEGKNALRELLNSAYKKGMSIEREKKKKTQEGETWITETYDVYTSIALANIWGMESVLGDRCITLTLEKSSKRNVTKLIETYDKDFSIQKIKALLNEIKNPLGNLVLEKNMAQYWNDYILEIQNLNLDEATKDFFKKVDETGIEGRNLELLMPLYFMAYLIDRETLNKILEISKEIVKEREEEDYFENKDKILMRFLSEKLKEGILDYLDYISTTKISNHFVEYLGDGNDKVSPEWIGKALKRLKVLKDRKRDSKGVRVLLNIDKINRQVK